MKRYFITLCLCTAIALASCGGGHPDGTTNHADPTTDSAEKTHTSADTTGQDSLSTSSNAKGNADTVSQQ